MGRKLFPPWSPTVSPPTLTSFIRANRFQRRLVALKTDLLGFVEKMLVRRLESVGRGRPHADGLGRHARALVRGCMGGQAGPAGSHRSAVGIRFKRRRFGGFWFGDVVA